ncbi:uncharacterized protein LOC124941993 [Impatiens glandulifera]|uniref:uncharacterized protein LOC124941993 n=1 Tax=Impatiens glandulifera TaxID=253017 RepID=UPI001FB06BDA|nr:uncharacterized protein LOC124941993 [Impatiens glandulifera]XP_047338353.1 uncharacterized protein LOC124941993 [Impatiens glandulifera]
MATATASTLSQATLAVATTISGQSSRRRINRVNYLNGLNSFSGLKAENSVVSLGLPVCTERSFAKIVSSMKKQGRRDGGGAMSSRCNAIGEIFTIAAVINGLVLVGVAVGFVLLRIEASVEEAEG